MTELRTFTEKLFNQLVIAKDKINELEDLVAHSKDLLRNVNLRKVPLEEEIIMREVEYVNTLSQNGGLNIEETKQFKMLVDSLVALRRNGEPVKKTKDDKLKGITPAKLLSIIRDDGTDGKA